MRVADRAARHLPGVNAVGLALGDDLVGGLVGVEGEADHQLAVGHHLADGGRRLRKLLARAPQVRVQGVQVGPQRRAGAGQRLGCEGLVQRAAVGVELQQRLLQEGGADEGRRARVGHAAGVGARKVGQRGHAARRVGHALAVGIQRELGHAPRCFQPFHRFRKIGARGRLAHHINVLEVRQALGKRAKQQALALHRQEIFTVDPHHIDGATGQLASGFFTAHALHSLGCVGQLHVLHLDAVAAAHFARCPLQVGVGAVTAAPGVHEDFLPARLGLNRGPGRAGLRPRRTAQQAGTQQSETLAAGDIELGKAGLGSRLAGH